jgi:hypothetical protein
MTVPSNLNALVIQINAEINVLEQELSKAIELIRERVTLFPGNIVSIQIFANLTNYDLFAQNTKKRVQDIIQYIDDSKDISNQDIQELGEDLSEQLGRILEAKTVIVTIKNRLRK